MPEDLPEGYYLDNFKYLLDFVVEKHGHLLSEPEYRYRDQFASASENAKKLYVRLTNRKGPHFRQDKINYPEINNLSAVVSELIGLSLVDSSTPTLEHAIALCDKKELSQLEAFAAWPKSCRRSEMVEQLIATGTCNPIEELDLPVIEVLGLEKLLVYRLLFFGNFHQDMTEFVLHELVSPFEAYNLSDESSAFSSRSIVDLTIELKLLSERAHEVIDTDETGDEIAALIEEMPFRPDDAMTARRFDRLLNRVARQLERLDRKEGALYVYKLTSATPSRERQARILEKLGRLMDALDLCEQIYDAPLDEEEWEFSLSFGQRLARKHQLETSLPRNDKVRPPQETIRISRVVERVELCAVQHYTDAGETCFYVENMLFRGIFGLAFWDIIFAPVPGAFFHPFQRGPSDLYTSDFVASRSGLIDRRCADLLDSDQLRQRVLYCYEGRYGVANQFVNWQYLSRELLELALAQIPAEHLCKVFDRLLIDLKNNASGLPDLIIFGESGYRLVEIKGPGDTIQKNQERWFRYFNTHGIPATLVNVEWAN